MANNKRILGDFQEYVLQIQRATKVNKTESEGDKRKRINRLLGDFEGFCQYYFPHYAKAAFSDFHKRFAKKVIAAKKIYIVREWARDHAKSVIAGLFLPIFLKAKGELKAMLLVSKSYDNAAELLRPIKTELEYNQRLKSDFGEQAGAANWEDGNFRTVDGSAFRALGAGQSPRGSRNNEQRPDYVLCDDIDSEEVSKNPARLEQLWEWVQGALFGSLSIKGGRFVLVNNRISKDCIVHRAKEIADDFEQINILDKNGKPSWSERFTKAECQYMIDKMGYRIAQREYFNNPIVAGTVFKEEGILYKRMYGLKRYDYLVCYTDPSWKGTSKNDFKATVLVGKTGNQFHIIDIRLDQASVTAMWQWHYEIYDQITDAGAAVTMHMEANFMQDIHFQELNRLGIKKNYVVPVSPDNRKKPDKFMRIEAMTPFFERGQIYFNERRKNSPHFKRAIDHLLIFEKGSRTPDDFPDALEGALYLLNQKARKGSNPITVGKRTINSKRF